MTIVLSTAGEPTPLTPGRLEPNLRAWLKLASRELLLAHVRALRDEFEARCCNEGRRGLDQVLAHVDDCQTLQAVDRL